MWLWTRSARQGWPLLITHCHSNSLSHRSVLWLVLKVQNIKTSSATSEFFSKEFKLLHWLLDHRYLLSHKHRYETFFSMFLDLLNCIHISACRVDIAFYRSQNGQTCKIFAWKPFLITCLFHQAGEFELMEDGNGTMMDYQVFHHLKQTIDERIENWFGFNADNWCQWIFIRAST